MASLRSHNVESLNYPATCFALNTGFLEILEKKRLRRFFVTCYLGLGFVARVLSCDGGVFSMLMTGLASTHDDMALIIASGSFMST